MSTKLTGFANAHYVLLARSCAVIFGCLAVWWGIVGLPIFWQESSEARISNRIIAGDSFEGEILASQLPIINGIEMSAYCRPEALRSAAIIRLRIAEQDSLAESLDKTNARVNAATDSMRKSLTCSPADPFLWLALYAVYSRQDGNRLEDLRYLMLSYQLGPNEGWIALKRNRIAFANFQGLPPEVSEAAIGEFVALLQSKFYKEAAEEFVGPAWPERELILLRLAHIADQDRQGLADELDKRGYNINLPGVVNRNLRPWH